jgi:uncharacterized protein YndB with AHSA1/START domain
MLKPSTQTEAPANGISPGVPWQPNGQVTPNASHLRTPFPVLHEPAAWPVARDRWERLVTRIHIPAGAAEVWSALTEPTALKHWLALCRGSLAQLHCECVLDFEDGEFFLCHSQEVRPPSLLKYEWRWLGIGQSTTVTWNLEDTGFGTDVTVTEEALNPPGDWQTWNGGGWPGILNQLSAYIRTRMNWRWPWRRMGPYVQVELPVSIFEAWDNLFSDRDLQYWLQTMGGSLAADEPLTILMGDASGVIEMKVREIVEPGQSPPSFLPYLTYTLTRPVWRSEVGGRLWIEPAGWGKSLFQVFHQNWENLPAELQLSERRILTGFWAGAMQRAAQHVSRKCTSAASALSAPHNWS